jgi:hypothetical protein
MNESVLHRFSLLTIWVCYLFIWRYEIGTKGEILSTWALKVNCRLSRRGPFQDFDFGSSSAVESADAEVFHLRG